jgi:hypothetical protein
MRMLRIGLLFLALALVAGQASAITIDFESFATGAVEPGGGFVDSGVTITSGALVGNDDHLGLTLFDSTNGPANGDPDLLVGSGNVLILQNSHAPYAGVTAGIYDTPNDDLHGGEILFAFSSASVLTSIDLIDINGGGAVTLTLTDSSGDERIYLVPDDWTGDIDLGDVGFDTLDLTTLANQAGVGPGNPDATASQDPGFDANDVVSLSVVFNGSAALDNLVFVPEPSTLFLIGTGLGLLAIRRRS